MNGKIPQIILPSRSKCISQLFRSEERSVNSHFPAKLFVSPPRFCSSIIWNSLNCTQWLPDLSTISTAQKKTVERWKTLEKPFSPAQHKKLIENDSHEGLSRFVLLTSLLSFPPAITIIKPLNASQRSPFREWWGLPVGGEKLLFVEISPSVHDWNFPHWVVRAKKFAVCGGPERSTNVECLFNPRGSSAEHLVIPLNVGEKLFPRCSFCFYLRLNNKFFSFLHCWIIVFRLAIKFYGG